MKNPKGRSHFATTHWSMVHAASGPARDEATIALASLCETYWYPLYAYVRRRGHGADDARDLTQAFFAKLLEKGYVHEADRARGRFRTFLLAALGNFLNKEFDREQALKRGGGRRLFSLDFETAEGRYLREPAESMTPEQRWALTLLDRVMAFLRDEYARMGKETLFKRLEESLLGDSAGSTYQETAEALGMTEGAVKAAAHRLRGRFREILRAEIREIVSTSDEIDDEIRLLFVALRGE